MSLFGFRVRSSVLVLSIVCLVCHAEDKLKSASTTPNSPTASTQSSFKFSASNGLTVGAPKDGLAKRETKVADLSGSATAKSYDPPPEFYRGPGSTSASSASSASNSNSASGYNNRDNVAAGFVSKPIAFPDTTNSRNKYGGDSSTYLANNYNSWQLLKGSAAGLGGGPGLQDRISVSHYGSPGSHVGASTGAHGGVGGGYSGGSSSGLGAGGYGYEGGRPYGGTPHIEYVPATGHYPSTGHGGGGGGYYGGGAGGGISAEGIPFDVYGTKGGGGGGGGGHYAGAGGEYSYTYPDAHEPPTHKGHPPDLSHKALLAKSFLIPLASAAVLGIAAALVSNPLLLQLGTVSGLGLGTSAVVGKRKRRDLSEGEGLRAKELLAYRGHKRRSLARV